MSSPPSPVVKKVVIEVRPRLQSACIFIHLNNDLANDYNVNVKEGHLVITHNDKTNRDTHIFNMDLKDLHLLEGSMSSKQHNDDCISLRMLTDKKHFYKQLIHNSGGFKAELLKMTSKFQNSLKVDCSSGIQTGVIVDTDYAILCKECKHTLCNNIMFERVLPLPNSDQDDWFCQCNDNHEKTIQIKPKYGDLLYLDSYYLLNPDILTANVDRLEKYLKCKACSAWLGTQDTDRHADGLYFNSTIFKSIDNDDEYTTNALKDVFCAVKSCLKESVIITPNVLLICQFDENVVQYLMLWIKEKQLQIKMYDSTGEKNMNVAKVLFEFVTSRNDVVDEWLSNTMIHSINVSKPMFDECLEHLKVNNLLLPKDFRMTLHTHVSYLMYNL